MAEVVLPENAVGRSFRWTQWRMLLATMVCYLFYYTGRQTFGFAIPSLEREFHLSKLSLGWISAGMLWCYAIGQAINGNLGDRFGGRRMMSLGAILSCGMNWVMSFGTSFVTLQIPWAINGYFQSMGWAPGSRLISNWWGQEERGKAYGLYVFAAGLSSILAFVTSTIILAMGLNWRWIFRAPVLLMLAGGVLYYFIARDTPQEMGFAALAAEKASAAVEEMPAEVESSLDRYKNVVTNPKFVIASLAIGFQSVARYGLLYWVPVYLLGENNPNAKWVSIALPVGMALGAMYSGWLSDRYFRDRRANGISLFMFLAAICAAIMFVFPLGITGGIVMLFLCGFFTYGPQAAFWALCPDLLGNKRAGTGTGVMDMCAYLFAGLGEPFIGWTIQSHANHTILIFPIVATSCILSAVVSLFIRR